MVEIEPKAFGLNFRDLMVTMGQLDETLKGFDCSGVITRLGPHTEESGLVGGDKVCAYGKGRFASSCLAPWRSLRLTGKASIS